MVSGSARRGESRGRKKRASQRGRERRASAWPYLLAGPSGGVHHGGRSGDGRSSTEQLVDQRRKTTGGVGLGRVGLRVGEEMGQIRSRTEKRVFFIQRFFLFCFPNKTLSLIYLKIQTSFKNINLFMYPMNTSRSSISFVCKLFEIF
jgi:hypothetical protein